jgi:hypothetical protein
VVDEGCEEAPIREVVLLHVLDDPGIVFHVSSEEVNVSIVGHELWDDHVAGCHIGCGG